MNESEAFGVEDKVPLSANVRVETIRPPKFQGISPPLGHVTPWDRRSETVEIAALKWMTRYAHFSPWAPMTG